MSETKNLVTDILPIKDFLCLENLSIPEFQRPYKWETKHVKQLLEDIVLHKDKSAYRLGTAVLYDNKDPNELKTCLQVVDGQQRLITMSLIAHALKLNKEKEPYVSKLLNYKEITLLNQTFNSEITKNNIVINFNEIKREVANFSEDEIRFFLNKCELVCITLFDISEAFQFFDSQNARGKDLDPHDLLKAFHLREMLQLPESQREKCIEDWENRNDDELGELFSQYLFRIRRWSKRKNGRYLNKSNASVFKGISLSNNTDFPFTYPLKINNVFTDEFNDHLHRKIDNNSKNYPFQLDQVIINGKRFFEMTTFYQQKVDLIKNIQAGIYIKNSEGEWVFDDIDYLQKLKFLGVHSVSDNVFLILKQLATYGGKNRIGDQYIRTLFECALLYYTDKFGNKDLERVLVKLFIWSYSLRLDLHSVQLASVDNRALEWNSVFSIIREATEPKEIYQMYLERTSEIRFSNAEEIKDLFIKLGYYDGK
tara:strand:- start:9593 stop:11038 length:1446 start_codon:yes stop_codon:yes gene_type:complete